MTFADYLAAKKISDQAAADELGLDRSTVANLRTRRRKPSIKVAAKIEVWSRGKVKASSFAEDTAA
jgi:hypothetical protein